MRPARHRRIDEQHECRNSESTRDPASKNSYTGPQREETLARIEVHFGDKDNAIAALQHLLNIPYGPPPVTPALLRIDPDWDNLRDDPRFQKLVASPAPKAPDK